MGCCVGQIFCIYFFIYFLLAPRDSQNNQKQDNDPTYRLARSYLRAWHLKHAASVILMGNRPPNSTNVNPIENTWGEIKAKINNEDFNGWAQFRAVVHVACCQVPLTMAANQCRSMPASTSVVLVARWGKARRYLACTIGEKLGTRVCVKSGSPCSTLGSCSCTLKRH